jgi:uncharacterized protein (TIGR02808 family)
VSTLESFFWHLLGYSAIPLILVAGIFVSSLVFYLLVRSLGSGSDD